MIKNSLVGFGMINLVLGNVWGKYNNECFSIGCMFEKQFLFELFENCKVYDGLE